MKVYRGPNSKDFQDDTHQLVSSNELSEGMRPWSGHYWTEANVTKEIDPRRQSVAHVGLSEADVLALHRALIEEKLRQFDELQAENGRFRKKTMKLETKIIDLKFIAVVPGYSDEERIAKLRERLNKR